MGGTEKQSSSFNTPQSEIKVLRINLLASPLPLVLRHLLECTVATVDSGVDREVCMIKVMVPIPIKQLWKQHSNAFNSRMRRPTMENGEPHNNIITSLSNCSQMSANNIRIVGSKLRQECPPQWSFEAVLLATIKMSGEVVMRVLAQEDPVELVEDKHFLRVGVRLELQGYQHAWDIVDAFKP